MYFTSHHFINMDSVAKQIHLLTAASKTAKFGNPENLYGIVRDLHGHEWTFYIRVNH